MELPPWLSARPGGVVISVVVQPRARRPSLAGEHGGALKVAVTAPALSGRANRALCELLATRLGVAPSAVTVVAGARARRKRLTVDGVGAQEAARALGAP